MAVLDIAPGSALRALEGGVTSVLIILGDVVSWEDSGRNFVPVGSARAAYLAAGILELGPLLAFLDVAFADPPHGKVVLEVFEEGLLEILSLGDLVVEVAAQCFIWRSYLVFSPGIIRLLAASSDQDEATTSHCTSVRAVMGAPLGQVCLLRCPLVFAVVFGALGPIWRIQGKTSLLLRFQLF